MTSGGSARAIDDGDLYFCSRCKKKIDPHATACPHCGRTIDQSSYPPYLSAIIKFGVFLLLGSGAIFGYGLAVGSLQPSSGPRIFGLFFLMNAILVFVIAVIYFILHTVFKISHAVFAGVVWWAISPFYRAFKSVCRAAFKPFLWAGEKAANRESRQYSSKNKNNSQSSSQSTSKTNQAGVKSEEQRRREQRRDEQARARSSGQSNNEG